MLKRWTAAKIHTSVRGRLTFSYTDPSAATWL